MISINKSPSTAVKEKSETKTEESGEATGDFASERFAHYVSKEELEKTEPGKPVVALCGKIWIPKKYEGEPICPECRKIYNSFRSGPEN